MMPAAASTEQAAVQPLLEVRDLKARYGRIEVLHGIDLAVGRGELVALVGANGAGKTTLLRVLSGVHAASAGRIVLDGKDIMALPPYRRVGLGICQSPEGRQVFGPMSVEDNILLGGYRRHGPSAAAGVERAYGLFPVLKEKRRQPAGTLSGGQQQMLAIARALIGGPKLLLLDEPTEGLAPVIVEELQRIIEDVRRAGVAVLLVEQNLAFCEALADRHYILDQGSIVFTADRAGFATAHAERERYLAVAAY